MTIDAAGDHVEVTTQYLYLGNEGKAAPLAKLETEHAPGNQTGRARVLYIHTDHRGEPLAMTDTTQRVVWQAQPDDWGYVNAQYLEQASATPNIRLPGQYFDEETGCTTTGIAAMTLGLGRRREAAT